MKRRTINLIGAILLAAALAFGFYVFYAQPGQFLFYTITTFLIVLALIWIGNSFISRVLNQRMPWLEYGKNRFFIQLFIGIFYSVGVINLAYFLVKISLTDLPPTLEQLIVTNVYGAIIFIPSYSIYFSLHFLSQWQTSQLEVERFQKESMRAQLASLKNHLDPHFLFNNLNILSALIDKDPGLSQQFLGRFAEVYRTMLLAKVEDLIPLEEEMNFIETYMYLIGTRFDKNIQYTVNLSYDALTCMIPPLTVQMLIENAIKHNNITVERPLKIEIYNEGDRLTIVNNLFEKPEEFHTKSGTGLNNIKSRYKYYTDSPLVFEKQNERFFASLPLIEIETL